jgi:hypothetical protein
MTDGKNYHGAASSEEVEHQQLMRLLATTLRYPAATEAVAMILARHWTERLRPRPQSPTLGPER